MLIKTSGITGFFGPSIKKEDDDTIQDRVIKNVAAAPGVIAATVPSKFIYDNTSGKVLHYFNKLVKERTKSGKSTGILTDKESAALVKSFNRPGVQFEDVGSTGIQEFRPYYPFDINTVNSSNPRYISQEAERYQDALDDLRLKWRKINKASANSKNPLLKIKNKVLEAIDYAKLHATHYNPGLVSADPTGIGIAHEYGHATSPFGKPGPNASLPRKLFAHAFSKVDQLNRNVLSSEDRFRRAAAVSALRQAYKDQTGEDNLALRLADYGERGISSAALLEEGQASTRGLIKAYKSLGAGGKTPLGRIAKLKRLAPGIAELAECYGTYLASPLAAHVAAPATSAVISKAINGARNLPKAMYSDKVD